MIIYANCLENQFFTHDKIKSPVQLLSLHLFEVTFIIERLRRISVVHEERSRKDQIHEIRYNLLVALCIHRGQREHVQTHIH